MGWMFGNVRETIAKRIQMTMMRAASEEVSE
jgi:hypothetical protein